ncbi:MULTISPECIES: FUSC family protein [Streptomyces]|uniref:FUSC family protein n=1 Tax=Streptomyces griseocarneus TaxID=51201 RepID=A0ABX7RTG4_9ACTN|nr:MULTISPECIES: FUSC family protein [Streptomyces]QSY50214.1 FUSC family protein [Streptomyces griseocarneus]
MPKLSKPLPARPLPLPLRGLVRLRPAADIWHKAAFSAAVAMVVPDLVLLALGRLDLVLYTAAGALCALYGHDRPYAARARTVAWVVLATVAGVGAALTGAALLPSAPLLVLGASLLAAVHKVVCDATRIGPPGNVVLTFVTSSAFFVPQRIGEVPGHLGLVLAAGALAWLVCMAPALVRPYGPERIAAARALEAAAGLLRAEAADTAPARHATAAAVSAARRALGGDTTSRDALRRAVARADAALAAGPADPAEAERLLAHARVLRGGGALGARLRAHAHLAPAGVRVATGATLAGWASLALGSHHPYWAVVTAAAVIQANTTATWQRAVQRALGNLLGLLLFTAVLPLARSGEVALVFLTLLLQIGAEAFIARNYWLGSVCVTPMALLLGEFGGPHPAGALVADRWTDTLVGVALGLTVCALVTNRRAAGRVHEALGRARAARVAAEAAAAGPCSADEARAARDRLGAALLALREAVDVAAGEWWQAAWPRRRAAEEEREGYRALAALGAGARPAADDAVPPHGRGARRPLHAADGRI